MINDIEDRRDYSELIGRVAAVEANQNTVAQTLRDHMHDEDAKLDKIYAKITLVHDKVGCIQTKRAREKGIITGIALLGSGAIAVITTIYQIFFKGHGG